MRRPAPPTPAPAATAAPASPAAPRPSLAPEPDLAEPGPAAPDDVRAALDATRGLLDELENRYQLPRPEAEAEKPRRPRRRPKT